MEIRKTLEQLTRTVGQYKYPMIVILIGLLIMLMPPKSKEKEIVILPADENIMTVEERLCDILSVISGAGKVRVLLTESLGEEIIYQTDINSNTSANLNDTSSDTVIVSDAERNESGLVRQVNPPVYLGAIIICEGADNPVVRLGIVEAVSTVTGLGADKISVLKMGSDGGL